MARPAAGVRDVLPRQGLPVGDVVHVWTRWLDLDEGWARSSVLDEEERARAARYRFERDRRRFIARRSFVRQVLSGYLDVAPDQLRIRASASGRPELDPPGTLSFNTSHSNGLAVLAVASRGSVGVDVEYDRVIPDALGLARDLFSERDVGLLRDTRASARSTTFLALWTRKESVVKAMGEGLALPLDRFDVAWEPREEAGRPTGPQGELPYAVIDVRGVAGRVAAVCLSGTQVETRLMPSAMS